MVSCSTSETDKAYAQTDSLITHYLDSVRSTPASTVAVFQKAKKHLTDSLSIQRLNLYIGVCMARADRPREASQMLRLCESYMQRHPHTDRIIQAEYWYTKGCMTHVNNADSTLSSFTHCYESLYKTRHRALLPEVLVYIADVYRQKGNFVQSTQFYRKAKMAADSLQDHRMDFSIYSGMGMAYGELHNFQLANHYFEMAENHFPKTPNYAAFFFYNSRGNIFYHEKKYAEALPYFRKAYNVAKKLNDEESQAIVDVNFGEIYLLSHQYDSARFYLDKTMRYIRKNPKRNQQLNFYTNSLYANLALMEKDLPMASRFLSKNQHMLKIAPQNKFLHYRRLMEYYEQAGNYKEALRLRKIVDQYDDSLRDFRNTENIRDLDYRYRQDTTLLRNNVTIKDKNLQLAHQRNAIVLLLAGLLIAFIILILWRQKNKERMLTQRRKIDELRMENIRNRVSPHYMFNVLNTIMPVFRKYTSLERILQLFVNVLRDNLLISDHIAITLKEEISLVKNFVDLRRETNPDTPTVEWHIGTDVQTETLIPSMVIQIPVENALKHAFSPDMDAKENTITIDITHVSNGLDIRIKDNGQGFTPGTRPDRKRDTGTGLKVLFHTIEMLNRENAPKASFHISCANPDDTARKGTLTSVFIPYRYKYNFKK